MYDHRIMPNIDTVEQIKEYLAAISPSTVSIDMSFHHFGTMHDDEVAQIFEALQEFKFLTSLNLSCNMLGIKDDSQWMQFFALIPPTIVELNLSQNYLGHRNNDELDEIFSPLPDSTIKVILENKTIDRTVAIEKQATLDPNRSLLGQVQNLL